jgi:NADH-quinone oxidoreductase subunit J
VSFELIVFLVLAAVAVLSGILMITRANPVNSALFLILNFISLAGIYLTLHAQFVAIIQILVYAGAIMVLVLFVIMLLNLEDEKPLRETLTKRHYASLLFAMVTLAIIVQVIGWQGAGSLAGMQQFAPFELTAFLLLAAMIGAVVLAKKRFP